MKNPIQLLIIIGLLISSFSGCKKGGGTGPEPIVPDTTKPVITITKPTAGQSFTPGSTIIFEASFSDNVKLKNYEIEVSKIVTGGYILKNVPVSEPFSCIKSSVSFNPDVKKQDITLSDILIPANNATKIVTPGNYNFKVNCRDGSDNLASTIIIISIN
jgi:hypothetical protein